MRVRRSDDERKPADIARAVELGVLDPLAPFLSAVRPNKFAMVHYRPRGKRDTLCGTVSTSWPVARRARHGLDNVCNDCRSKASRLRAFVRWAGVEWPEIPCVRRTWSW